VFVEKKIVEKIIAELLLDSDNDDESMHNNFVSMNMFQLQKKDEQNEDIDFNPGRYLVSIMNVL
jgi:hypothetical protein